MVLAIILAFLAAVGISAGNVLIRVGMQRVSPPTATFFGVVAGAVVITGMALAFNMDEVRSLRPTNFIWFAVLAALAYPVARVLSNTAITWVGASRAAPWSSLRPLFALALGIALLGERPNLPVALGTPMIVCGLILVVLAEGAGNREEERGTVRRAGYLLAIGATFCFASRDVVSRHVVGNIVDPLVTASMALLLGCVMLFALTAPDIARNMRRLPARNVVFCGLSGISQALGVASLFQALSLAPVTVVTPINAIGPLVTLALVQVFLQRVEAITLRLVLGTVLSVAGVIVVILGALAY